MGRARVLGKARAVTERGRFACLMIGLALIVIAWLMATSRSHGRQFGEPFDSEDMTITVWGECAL